MPRKKYSVCVVGIGAVGQEMLRVLWQRRFPMKSCRVVARRARVEKVDGRQVKVESVCREAFRGVDIALFAGSEEKEGHFGWPAVEEGAVVIDNSPVYRLYPNVPLVVPEVNPEDLRNHEGLIGNPNCSTIQLVVALKPLHDFAGLRRVVVSTYQPASGKGHDAMAQLDKEWKHAAAGKKPPRESCFPYPIASNLIPHIDQFFSDAYTLEETKLLHESRKILGLPHLQLTATAVRVPVMNGLCESVNVEFARPISAARARALLRKAPGVVVQDDPAKKLYPMPYFVSGKDEVYVGRIREDHSVAHGLNLWVAADNVRKGAALNAVQIAEKMIEMKLL
jgi:aspartate-semialdehyde dehydrogenase